MPICSWCGGGSGQRFATADGIKYYYVCSNCISDTQAEVYYSDSLKPIANRILEMEVK